MGQMKKKYESGAATNYISRNQCLKKLQLNLKDFRRLCIMKGIYPHQPTNKKKVNKGGTENKTWYYAKDIMFLQHEPIVKKFREYKIFVRKLRRAEAKKQPEKAQRARDNMPVYQLDHIVRERYATFTDALRDLDDALCTCFLFARLPKVGSKVPQESIDLCRRFSVEFMHYVIAAKALRKVFVSIKGIYYQAEIQGNVITWVVPHDRGIPKVSDVDFSVMATFVEFYQTLLGFVNFKLYQSLGLYYPPKLAFSNTTASTDTPADKQEQDEATETIASLGRPLAQSMDTSLMDTEVDEFSEELIGSEEYSRAKQEQRELTRLKALFSTFKFFLNREVPKESLAFIIRSFGGQVSWDCGYGASYTEDDPSITHHVIDRPSIKNQRLSRCYVQPQWVYDCVNSRMLLPVKDYFVGTVLPPHLSPFTEEKPGEYVPPEKIALVEAQANETVPVVPTTSNTTQVIDAPKTSVVGTPKPGAKRPRSIITEPSEVGSTPVAVTPGKVTRQTPQAKINRAGEEQKLREMMVPKRYKNAYKKMKFGEKRKGKEARKLAEKRKSIDGGKATQMKNIE